MKMRDLGIACLGLIVSICAFAEEPSEDMAKGKKLFEKYGCTNCHGQDGIHPTSKYVPILKGISTSYFYENAIAIFDDDRANRKVHAMHDQFCIGAEPEEGCYPVPASQDLMIIANWLGVYTLPAKKTHPAETLHNLLRNPQETKGIG